MTGQADSLPPPAFVDDRRRRRSPRSHRCAVPVPNEVGRRRSSAGRGATRTTQRGCIVLRMPEAVAAAMMGAWVPRTAPGGDEPSDGAEADRGAARRPRARGAASSDSSPPRRWPARCSPRAAAGGGLQADRQALRQRQPVLLRRVPGPARPQEVPPPRRLRRVRAGDGRSAGEAAAAAPCPVPTRPRVALDTGRRHAQRITNGRQIAFTGSRYGNDEIQVPRTKRREEGDRSCEARNRRTGSRRRRSRRW